VINTITGHLDRRGGLMFTAPAIDLVAIGACFGQQGHFDRYRSSVRELAEFGGELPAATMAEEILTNSERKIRAMVVCAGNPVLSAPNGKQLDIAFGQLDFMLSIDMYVTETSRHANLILPPTGPLERSHIDVVFAMLAVRNTVKYSPPLYEPAPDSLHDWQIFLELARRLNRDDVKATLKAELRYQLLSRLGPDGLADFFLRIGPYGSELPVSDRWRQQAEGLLKTLPPEHPLRELWRAGPVSSANRNLPKGLSIKMLAEQHPHGLDLGPLRPCLPERLYTPNKKIRLAPRLYLRDLPRVQKLINEHAADQLLLIGRRHVRSNNSWMHNSYRLVKGKNRCTLMIHPRDAVPLGLENAQLAEVTSRVGSIKITVEVTEDMMPGVVSIPHGWGHKRRGVGWKTARKYAGVSVNDLTDDQRIDQLTGNAALNGVPVTVRAIVSRKSRVVSSPL
jgi:anaerobic selenocysteine-containing dehydrogenase